MHKQVELSEKGQAKLQQCNDSLHAAISSLRKARMVCMAVEKFLQAALPAAGAALVLSVLGLWHMWSMLGVVVLWVAAAVAMIIMARSHLSAVALAKDADDYLGTHDTMASALDFLGRNRREWMCLETVGIAATLAPKVKAHAVYRPQVPRNLGLILAGAAVLNVAAFFGAGAIRKSLSHSLTGDGSSAIASTGGRDGSAGSGSQNTKQVTQAMGQKVDIGPQAPAATPSPEANVAPPALTSADNSAANSASDVKDIGNIPKNDGRVTKDEFADIGVTKVDSELTKDLKLQKSETKMGAETPGIKLSQAEIEKMLQSLKEKKEENKKSEQLSAQVAVGIKAPPPEGSKLKSGSPGGGGGEENSGEQSARTEDTRVEARRLTGIKLVEFPLPQQGGKANGTDDKDAAKTGRVGTGGMQISYRVGKDMQLENQYKDVSLGNTTGTGQAADAAIGLIPFGMKDHVQQYFDVLAKTTKEDRK